MSPQEEIELPEPLAPDPPTNPTEVAEHTQAEIDRIMEILTEEEKPPK